MHLKSIAELSADLHAKKISSVELTRHFLGRIKQFNPKLNAFITLCEEEAIAQALIADDRLQHGNGTPLTGIPIAQKDLFCTFGVKTTCGSKMLSNFVAPYDATLVKRCNEAGMVLLGKTNMDEFAMGSSNEASFYGPVKNPWNLDCVPGGSSGGSAAAVATRIVPVATGTDTGGSIRQPAAFTATTGLKPTYGSVSRFGMIAFASSLDQGGVFTQTAQDCAMMMNAIAGFDPADSTSVAHVYPDYAAHLHQSIAGVKIGVPKQYFGEGLDPAVANAIDIAIKDYEKLGAKIISIELPNNHLALPAYYVIAPAEASSNLARYDGVRYGYRCQDPKDLQDMYFRSRAEGFGEEVKRRILIGTYVLSAGYFDAYYIKAQKVRRLIQQDFVKAFHQVDVILGPTTPQVAFKFGEKSQDPVSMYLSDIYTVAVNLAGLPGLSIPAGFSQGLPIGLQLIGNYFKEDQLLMLAHAYQQETDWHQQVPELAR